MQKSDDDTMAEGDRREALRASVIMPDVIEEPQWNVDGPREYRRNAWSMVGFGAFLIVGPIVLVLLTGYFFYVMPVIGLILIGMGINRLGATPAPAKPSNNEPAKPRYEPPGGDNSKNGP
ncbi:MAG: hypothetical protein H6510_15320 [Acidobacteria bacterium]|nr:hypothetical protein [Acidobacteriota bacterium]MCB9399185.1 hypothetical protein [Acidobacteriota bacterium]